MSLTFHPSQELSHPPPAHHLTPVLHHSLNAAGVKGDEIPGETRRVVVCLPAPFASGSKTPSRKSPHSPAQVRNPKLPVVDFIFGLVQLRPVQPRRRGRRPPQATHNTDGLDRGAPGEKINLFDGI